MKPNRDENERSLSEAWAGIDCESYDQLFKAIFLSSPIGKYVGQDGKFVLCNPAFEKITGHKKDELRDMHHLSLVVPDDRDLVRRNAIRMLKGSRKTPYQFRVHTRKGEVRWIIETVVPIVYRGQRAVLGNSTDITGQKKLGESFEASEEKYRALVENINDVLFTLDAKKTITYISPVVERVTKYKVKELLGQSFTPHIHPDDLAGLLGSYKRLLSGQVEPWEFRFKDKDGEIRFLRTSSRPIYKEGRIVGVSGLLTDITDHRKAEDELLRSRDLLQTVIDATPDWMCVKDYEHKYIMVNKSFAQAQHLSTQDMIGRPDTDFFSEELCLGNPEKGITGFHADDLQAFQGRLVQNPGNHVTWADNSQHVYDTYEIPLRDKSGNVYGALVYSRDSTERQRAEEEREASIDALQRTLRALVDTMVKVVEMRDPYTAEHQHRVADLAGAIAREMKMDDLRVEHLVMAAKIHDIGKMYVPSDILSKPGKLTDTELDLIKTHTLGSYSILRDIEFSHPIALMVLQHHERLDGSGYPQGSTGKEMLTESKILAVADVVEAMASHRPYRAALGIEKALHEISRNKGKLYDPEVVDVCLMLFKERGFKFEDRFVFRDR
ncbi:MAG: PAS domain S-box protein [Dehalococcoidia bacterium]